MKSKKTLMALVLGSMVLCGGSLLAATLRQSGVSSPSTAPAPLAMAASDEDSLPITPDAPGSPWLVKSKCLVYEFRYVDTFNRWVYADVYGMNMMLYWVNEDPGFWIDENGMTRDDVDYISEPEMNQVINDLEA